MQNSSNLRRLTILNACRMLSLLATMVRFTVLEELEISYVDLLNHLPKLPLSLKCNKIYKEIIALVARSSEA